MTTEMIDDEAFNIWYNELAKDIRAKREVTGKQYVVAYQWVAWKAWQEGAKNSLLAKIKKTYKHLNQGNIYDTYKK